MELVLVMHNKHIDLHSGCPTLFLEIYNSVLFLQNGKFPGTGLGSPDLQHVF